MDWSSIWEGMGKIDFDLKKGNFVWSFYEKLLGGYDFRGKKVLEFGCGTGINSIIMASRGADVTFVDTSRAALDLVKYNLDRLGLKAKLVQQDVFDFKEAGKYDLVHSEGLVEHFLPPKRQEIVDIHARAAKKGGKVLIIVPHNKCPPYRFGKALAGSLGCWLYGNEYPYTKKELLTRMKWSGLRPGDVVGGEFLFSLFWLFTPITLRSRRMLRKGAVAAKRKKFVRLNYNNRFADRWGRVIGCVGEKA